MKNAHERRVNEQQSLFGTTNAPIPLGDGCQIVSVGKRRDGGTRYWCLKHRADATAKYGNPAVVCRTAHFAPIEPKDVLTLDLTKYPGGVALWGAVPPVYDTTSLPLDRGIHVHSRTTPEGEKELDNTFRAVRIVGQGMPDGGLYVDELDAIYYMATTIFGYTMREVRCTFCRYSHLDRDWFSVHPHSRHLCAGCGKHFTDTQSGIGNPICGVRDALGVQTRRPKSSVKKLTIRQADYPGGIQIWGSNPAFIWTGTGAEAEGIHVHAYKEGKQLPDIDETYGSVIIDDIPLDQVMVRLYMAQAILPTLKGRITTVTCNSCGENIISEGDGAFTPALSHRCNTCDKDVPIPGRRRKCVANPLPNVLAQLEKHAVRPPQKHDLGLLPETI